MHTVVRAKSITTEVFLFHGGSRIIVNVCSTTEVLDVRRVAVYVLIAGQGGTANETQGNLTIKVGGAPALSSA